MKTHIAMKRVTEEFYHVYKCGYCDLQNICYDKAPTFYNSGVYGWNCDVYTFGSIAISTGYRNTRGKRIPHDVIRKYDDKARAALNGGYNYETTRPVLEAIRREFFKELKTL